MQLMVLGGEANRDKDDGWVDGEGIFLSAMHGMVW